MNRFLISSVLLLTMLLGCVAYPTTRSYFEPNSEDGVLTATSGCGYHTTKLDSLVREIGDISIQVIPEYLEADNLKVTIFIKRENDYVSFEPELVVLDAKSVTTSGDENQTLLKASDITSSLQVPTKSTPYYGQWYVLTFPVAADELNGISITLSAESLALGENSTNDLVFRFKKIAKQDFYYNSINC